MLLPVQSACPARSPGLPDCTAAPLSSVIGRQPGRWRSVPTHEPLTQAPTLTGRGALPFPPFPSCPCPSQDPVGHFRSHFAAVPGLLLAVTMVWTSLASAEDLGGLENAWAGPCRKSVYWNLPRMFSQVKRLELVGCWEEDPRAGAPSLSLRKSSRSPSGGGCPCRVTPPPFCTSHRKVTGPHPSWGKGSQSPSPASPQHLPSAVTS